MNSCELLDSMTLVEGGDFQMGDGDEKHTVTLPDFYISKYPLTNAAYQKFVEAEEREAPRHWIDNRGPEILLDHPVVNISWYDALHYCEWLSKRSGKKMGLPSEAAWEKAARGPQGWDYPWGDSFEKGFCNNWEAGGSGTTAVDQFPQGRSFHGLLDLSGNVWEWCNSLIMPYPYNANDGREELTSDGWRILRGGSWLDTGWGLRIGRRIGSPAEQKSHNSGFRLLSLP